MYKVIYFPENYFPILRLTVLSNFISRKLFPYFASCCAPFNFLYLSSIQTPAPDDPVVDFYTVNISSTDGQPLCASQTVGGNVTTVVLNVTGCVMCQGSNKNYAITVEASNRGGQTVSTTSLCKTITCENTIQIFIGQTKYIADHCQVNNINFLLSFHV